LRGNNVIEAAKWYQKAAEQGNAEAQEELGEFYLAGNGVEKKTHKAAEWYRKAAEQDNVEAQYKLGLCYALGQGVLKR